MNYHDNSYRHYIAKPYRRGKFVPMIEGWKVGLFEGKPLGILTGNTIGSGLSARWQVQTSTGFKFVPAISLFIFSRENDHV